MVVAELLNRVIHQQLVAAAVTYVMAAAIQIRVQVAAAAVQVVLEYQVHQMAQIIIVVEQVEQGLILIYKQVLIKYTDAVERAQMKEQYHLLEQDQVQMVQRIQAMAEAVVHRTMEVATQLLEAMEDPVLLCLHITPN